MKTPQVSDELLAKFLDNKTSKEETEIVLKFINEDKENFEEFLTIRKASMLVDQKPCNTIDDISISVISSYNQKPFNNKKKKVLMFISIAASVLFIISISFYFVFRSPLSNPSELTQNNKQNSIKVDSIKNKSISSDDKKGKQIDSSTENNQSSNDPNNTNGKVNDEVQVQIKTQNYGSTQSVENKFEMVKPSKSPYSILCKNLEKELIFQWNIVNAKKIEISLLNSNRKLIVSHSDSNMKSYSVFFKNLNKEKTIIWELKVLFEDNTTQTKTGVIHITYQ